jgi:4-amino-4-deoxy-L-arabinose transferase-like glycosyltransferase
MSASADNGTKPGAGPRTGQGRLSRACRGGLLQWLLFAAMIAFVSLSLADVFLIPPGEGFDEVAHYSYVSLLADEGRIPVIGRDALDAAWQERREHFPEPYAVPDAVRYREFFEQPEAARRVALAAWYGRPDGPIRYRPGRGWSWEGQHPPLYYLLMVPVYKLTAGLSIGQRLLWMRLVSVIIACSSIVFFRAAWRAAAPEAQRRLALGVALVALTPALALDVARLGNDSLSMALAAALFWQLLALRTTKRPWLTVAVVGIILGLGCLTKAFFVAFAPGVIGAVALMLRHRARWRTVLAQCAVVVLLCVAIAGWWPVRSHRLYGMWLVASDALAVRNAPATGLGPLEFAWEGGRWLGVVWATYFYCGTWSFALPPLGWYVPYGVLTVLVVAGFVGRFRPAFWRSGESAVLLALPLVVVGLVWHTVLMLHAKGIGQTSSYYLHITWPFMALLLGGALLQLRRGWTRALIAASLVGCFVTARVGDLAQLLLYGGIAAKAPSGFIAIPEGSGLAALAQAARNLGELVPLGSGLPFYVVGVAAQLAALILAARWLTLQEPPVPR